MHGSLHEEICAALPEAYTCVSMSDGFLFFHLNVKFHMLDTGMYGPVILPAVTDSTPVNPSTSAIAQKHTNGINTLREEVYVVLLQCRA